MIQALKKLARWDDKGRCWFPGGMGPVNEDGRQATSGYGSLPAPVIAPLVKYWKATGGAEGLEFARAYTEGMIENLQPHGARFQPDGSFSGHSHATMHSVWGVAELGAATGERRYIDFAKRVWDWILTRGPGTGWFPASTDDMYAFETCCLSDMMSITACLGRSGHPEYYDFLERFFRNYISNLQFVLTPEFEAYYRSLHTEPGKHAKAWPVQITESIERSLTDLKKYQGGVIGGAGLHDYENSLLGYVSGFMMYGCCAPEGMRAIHTTWYNTIDQASGPKGRKRGVYVNLSLNRESPWGRVMSFVPEQGRITVKAAVKDAFYLRPPHWAPRDQVRAFVGTKPVPTKWDGVYVRFQAKLGDELTITYPMVEFTHHMKGLWELRAPDLEMTYHWRGNMVVGTDPVTDKTPIFRRNPRILSEPPL